MGMYAELRKEYLKERRPQLYKELKSAGKLESHCLEREREALDRKNRLMQISRLNEDQIDEMIRSGLFDQ